ncbi:MAG: hypothetical protein LBV12_10225, partial [Puniceicoccales bacterium]|nr:hypothetical protein [Puniceicoccales bacterium]
MLWDLKSETRTRLERFLNGILVLCSTISLGLFIYILGWPIAQNVRQYVQVITDIVLGFFVIQEVARVVIQKQPWSFLKTRKPEIILSIVILAELFFGQHFHDWLRELMPDVPSGTMALFLLGCSQFTLLILIGIRFLRENRIFSTMRLSPGGALVLSFASLILIGTLLLKTPQATYNGIGWVDALFTATSSVCVTGLGTVDMATGFTRQGHWIILGLVQIGGLGMMTLTYFFAYFLAGGVSLRNQTAIQNLFSEDNIGQVGTVLGIIIGFTLTFEAIGAFAMYFFLMQGGNVPNDPVFFSIFHSVSAFCNAGISTLPGNLSDPSMRGYEGVMGVVMVLIIMGGIGFPVVKNFWQVAGASFRKCLGLRTAVPPRLTTNSRVVLVTTFTLLVGGTLLIYITEFILGNGSS